MRKLSPAFFMFASLFTLGCSPDTTTSEKAGVIPEHQLKALEQAKQTDDLLKEAEKQRQKQLE